MLVCVPLYLPVFIVSNSIERFRETITLQIVLQIVFLRILQTDKALGASSVTDFNCPDDVTRLKCEIPNK